MTKKEFQNKYSPKYDEITINGVTISYDCYEINVEDGKDVVCFYNEGGYCFMCSIPLEDVDLINRQQAEIERLNGCVKSEEEVRAIANATIQAGIRIIKAEAIKELEAKIHEKLHQAEMHGNFEPVVTREMFDSVAKEVVGEGK